MISPNNQQRVPNNNLSRRTTDIFDKLLFIQILSYMGESTRRLSKFQTLYMKTVLIC